MKEFFEKMWVIHLSVGFFGIFINPAYIFVMMACWAISMAPQSVPATVMVMTKKVN